MPLSKHSIKAQRKNQLNYYKILLNTLSIMIKKREGKSYYLLNLLKELVNNGNTKIHKTMLKLRHKSLFELIFITIVLCSSVNENYKYGFEYFPKK